MEPHTLAGSELALSSGQHTAWTIGLIGGLVVILAVVSILAALLGQRWHLVVERSLGSFAARRRTRAVALVGAAALVLVPLVAAGPTALVRGLSSSGDAAGARSLADV